MPLTHINSTPSGQFPAKKAGNIHKIPASWRVAKNLAPSINTIKSTSTCLLSLDMGEPILAKPQSLNALRDTIKERLHNHHDESAAQGIAVYGFAAQQLNNCHYLYSTKPRKAITTISNFNTKLDLVKETFNYQLSHRDYIYQLLFRQVDNFIDALYENKPKYYLYVGNKNLAPYLHAWKEYLNKLSHKTDLFKYIHSKEISIEEKNKVIKKLIIKNTSSSVDS